jgi:alpha-1,3-glucosyltransferase
MCAVTTLAAMAPAMAQQMRRPSQKGLLLCMASSAFSFFLFSYQVHEKSILLPLMPITLLAPDLPGLAAWMPAMSCFSMFPLLKKDGLWLAYLSSLLFWGAAVWPNTAALVSVTVRPRRTSEKTDTQGITRLWPARLGGLTLAKASLLVCLVLHALAALFQPPKRLPFLYDALITAFAFVHFAGAALYVQALLWRQDLMTHIKVE